MFFAGLLITLSYLEIKSPKLVNACMAKTGHALLELFMLPPLIGKKRPDPQKGPGRTQCVFMKNAAGASRYIVGAHSVIVINTTQNAVPNSVLGLPPDVPHAAAALCLAFSLACQMAATTKAVTSNTTHGATWIPATSAARTVKPIMTSM